MAIVRISHTRNAHSAVSYCLGPAHDGSDYRNLSGTGINCPSDPNMALAWMETGWKRFRTARKDQVRIYRYIQSFDDTELDPNVPDDVNKCNQLGQELAKKIMNGSHRMAYVFTQADGKGHKLHNHILIQNQDYVTGRCLRGNEVNFYYVRHLNDQVLKENGMEQHPNIKGSSHSYDRQTMAEWQLTHNGQYSWKVDLKDRIDQAIMQDQPSSWSEFVDNLNRRGVALKGFKKKAYDGDRLIHDDKSYRRASLSFRLTDTDEHGKPIQKSGATARGLGEAYNWDNLDDLIQIINQQKLNVMKQRLQDQQKERTDDNGRESKEFTGTDETTTERYYEARAHNDAILNAILEETSDSRESNDGRTTDKDCASYWENERQDDSNREENRQVRKPKPVKHKRKRKQRDDGLDL